MKKLPNATLKKCFFFCSTVMSSFKKSVFFTASAAFIPRVQQPAPHFEATAVVGGEFNTLKLSDFNGKYVILMFYPLDL